MLPPLSSTKNIMQVRLRLWGLALLTAMMALTGCGPHESLDLTASPEYAGDISQKGYALSRAQAVHRGDDAIDIQMHTNTSRQTPLSPVGGYPPTEASSSYTDSSPTRRSLICCAVRDTSSSRLSKTSRESGFNSAVSTRFPMPRPPS